MLRAIYGFEHCAVTQNPTYGKPVNPIVADFGYKAKLSNSGFAYVDQTGFLGGNGSGGDFATSPYVSFDMTGLMPKNPESITFGFRLRIVQNWAGVYSMVAFTLPSPTAMPTSWVLGLPLADMKGRTEVFVEVTFDVASKAISVLLDGVPTTPGYSSFTDATVLAGIAAGTWAITVMLSFSHYYAAGSPPYPYARYAIRDMYVLDSAPGDGMVGPIGPQQMYPIYPDQASGDGWVSSTNQDLLSSLNVIAPTLSTISSPEIKTPLNLSMVAAAPMGIRINAVSLMLAGATNGVPGVVNKVELAQGSNVGTPMFVAVGTDGAYAKPLGIYPKALDGGVWDSAKINALTVTLTPDTSA